MISRVVLIASLPLRMLIIKNTRIVQFLRYASVVRAMTGLSIATFPGSSSYTLEIGARWLRNKYIFSLDFYSISFFMLRYLVL